MKNKKEKTRAWYKKNHADFWFSKFIRLRDNYQCYTCGKQNSGVSSSGMQCGHFVPRQYLATRYDERNNHCQCWVCNMIKNGEPSIYAAKLSKQYGSQILEELETSRQKIIVDMDYKKIGDEYKQKYEILLNQENML